ncbi:MAG: RNA 3'-terminal phosphate cyclase, partial [Chloroflexota bacterium]|nr:RNA 3'-terminal phosphate cyclase [Chloroflexota bacterium]
MLTLDGAHGEGGGQILRTALVLSLLTGQPFRIERIRQGRTPPGLKPQHVYILKALLQMSDARAEGVKPGASSLTFQPGTLRGGVYHLEIGTAGAIPLFLQTILPAALFAPSPIMLTVTGGTDVRGAMTMDFWQAVLLPFLQPYA